MNMKSDDLVSAVALIVESANGGDDELIVADAPMSTEGLADGAAGGPADGSEE